MTMQYQAREGCLQVCLEGELGHHEAIHLMSQLSALVEDHLPGQLILNLEGLDFMDSSGIAVVVQTARKCAGYGGRLSVVHTPQQAKKVFDAAGLDRLVDIC